MIIVHYLEDSRAHRILWMLEELGLDYEIRTYKRRPDMRAPSDLKKIHPLGKSPVIEDDGRVIAESGAIIQYLVDTYGDHGLVPEAGSQAYRDYVYFLHYAEGSAMPLLLTKLIFLKLPGQLPFFLKPLGSMIATGVNGKLVDPQLADHTAFWEKSLSRSGWFAGSGFSAADIMMSFPVEASATRVDLGNAPATAAFMKAIRSRPAYQAALKRGGAYAYSESQV